MQKLKKLQYLPIHLFLATKKFLNKIFGKFFEVRTYHLEMAFVAVILIAVALITKRGFIEWIGVIAVFLTFGYIKVADRLREAEEVRNKNREPVSIQYYWKLDYYYMSKEMFWLLYFVILGAYSAIIGIFVFLCYRPWRAYYRKYSELVKNIEFKF